MCQVASVSILISSPSIHREDKNTQEEALVDYNMHFERYGSFGVLVQPERQMNQDAYIR